MDRIRTVVFVVYDDIQLLDFAGPVDVLTSVDNLRGKITYRKVIASATGRRIRALGGIDIGVDGSLAAIARDNSEIDTLVVVGGFGAFAAAADQRMVVGVRALASRARRIASVCSGAEVLAAAGLLDGYRATTHWSWCDQLADRYPEVAVEPDQIYVRDRNRWTSAGVTAGIDLALAFVEDDFTIELAHAIARWLVVFARRPGGQSQFSAQLRSHPARTPAVRAVQQWIPDNLDADLNVVALAQRAGMSERNFARVFRAETGETPAYYVESLRVEAARRLLETTELTIAAIAKSVGFKHAETLHRAMSRRLATTPDRYRQHFATKAS
ncbi:GlxA family transcriptional regulator [Antrihabitans sp. YC2-6]|uniref:GlxA family transcriptional regulator n=1 Tax=Antrihabitans sp. YC2-6 TaxID=2799498 RepID=UPI0018F5F7F3|nr:GlxA family transcriptional regulator [Antrihabitans sp. YC2-6]MBJ8346601.1 GlxA family transcriptional regulator [Antrihabitans sp. YC2-6]